MHFRIEQNFAAPIDDVLAAFTDPSYLATMGELADLGTPVVEEQTRTPTTVSQRLRFAFSGRLPSAVTRVIDPSRLSWHEHTDVDLPKATGTFRMVPIHYPRFFTCSGGWTLTTVDATHTRRAIEGDLKVNSPVPFVGGKVERAIVSGLTDRLAAEPAVFARWYRPAE